MIDLEGEAFIREIWLAGVLITWAGISLYLRMYGSWLFWAGFLIQVLNIILYSLRVIPWQLCQSMAMCVLGFCLVAQLLFAYQSVRKGCSVKALSSLSWSHLAEMVEWRLAEAFDQKDTGAAQIRTLIHESLQRAALSKQGRLALEEKVEGELCQGIFSKLDALRSGALDWRKEFVPLIEREEETLRELRQIRRQLYGVILWGVIGLVFILLGRHL